MTATVKTSILTILLFLVSIVGYTQSPVGKWKTVDDETGKVKSVVEIYEKGGKLYGKVIKLFRAPNLDQNPSCQNCTGDRKGAKILGLEIIRGLKKDGTTWKDGTILDPENGKVYDCKIWVEGGKLQLRGYIAFFYRTQTWLPYKD
ncbi:MAG: DUF2147 domain-containing protein [Bacteroidota bacterium]